MASHTRCHGVVVLDVRGLSPVTDFFVIATGTSARQMKSVADDIMEMAAERDEHAMSSKGLESESWILVDFVDVVVHVLSQDARLFYDLDNLWGDARRVEWEEPASQK